MADQPQPPSPPPSLDGAAPSMGPAPGAAVPQPRQPLKTRLLRAAPYFRGTGRGALAVVVASVLTALTEMAIPALFKAFMDRGFGPSRGYPLWWVPVLIIGLFALRGLATYASAYSLAWLVHRTMAAVRRSMFGRLMDAAPDLYARQSASSITNTLVHEAHQGVGLLAAAAQVLVRDSLTVVALLGWLFWLNWRLTLAVLVVAPLVGYVMRRVSKRLQRLSVQAQKATDDLSYVVEENVLAWRLVRLHNASATQAQRFGEANDHLRRVNIKAAAAGALSSPLTQLIASMALSGVLVMALWQGDQGLMTMGDFVAFVTAMLMLLSPLKHLADVTAPLTRGLVALERGLDLVDHHPVEHGGSHAVERARGDISFEGVTLRYHEDAAPALDNVTLRVEPGRVLALVGPSGGGKSTLVSLLPRFVDPTAGRVLLDGVPLSQWSLNALRQQFALVSQDVTFFNDSIAANVTLGQPVDEARVRRALADANLLSHVETMSKGIHSHVGHNASQLSGGQRQRLAIARAIYKDAPILILDEATSALDSHAERAVQEALERLMKGRTTIVIAHRLATVEHADELVVMAQGRVMERGTPQALKANGGAYAQLAAMQFRH